MKIVAIIAGSLFALCAGLVVLGLIVGPQPTHDTAQPAAATAAPAAPGTTQAAPPATSAAPPPTTQAAPPKTTAAAPPPTTQAPARQGSELCKVTQNGAVYYRWVTSATDFNFSACNGATVVPGNLDDLFNREPNVDRRCILGDAATAKYDAIVGVYSDTGSKNLAAAKAYCTANGGEFTG